MNRHTHSNLRGVGDRKHRGRVRRGNNGPGMDGENGSTRLRRDARDAPREEKHKVRVSSVGSSQAAKDAEDPTPQSKRVLFGWIGEALWAKGLWRSRR